MNIIDFHMHATRVDEFTPQFIESMRRAGKDDSLETVRRTLETPAALLDYLDDQGIDYAVCLAEINPMTIGVSPNERVARFCSASERLIPFGSVNPHITGDMTGELVKSVESGHRGFKLYPCYQHFYPNDSRLYPFYEKAQEMGIPLMFHTGSSNFPKSRLKYGDPLLWDDVAVDFPRLKIVMAHSGRGLWYDRAFFMARLHRHVYLEVSGLPPHKLLEYFPELEKLKEKVIFGSDWPEVTDIARNISAIRSLPLSEGTKDNILGLNAARMLDLP